MAKGQGFGVSFNFKGDQQLYARLRKLKSSLQKKIMRQAVTAAIRPIRMEAKANAPVETQQLKKMLTVKVKTYKGAVIGLVGVKADSKSAESGRNPAKYLHLVTGGTKPHTITAKRGKLLVGKSKDGTRTVYGAQVQHPGAKPNTFLVDAISTKQQEAIDKFSAKMKEGIEREANKSK